MNLSASDQILIASLTPYIQEAKEHKTNTFVRFHKERPSLVTSFRSYFCQYGLSTYFASSGWLEFDHTTNKVHIVVITKNSIYNNRQSKVKLCYALDGVIKDDLTIEITSQKEVVIKRVRVNKIDAIQTFEKIRSYIAIQKIYSDKFPGKVSDAPKLFPLVMHNQKYKIELEQKKYDGNLGKLAKTLDSHEINSAFLDCARVLSELHKDNYAHCDVKIFNILLSQNQASLNDWEFVQQCGTYRNYKCYYYGWDSLKQKGIATPFTDVWSMTVSLGMLFYGKPFVDRIEKSNTLTLEFLKEEYENGASWIMQQEFDDEKRKMSLLLNKKLHMWISTIFTQEKMIQEYIEAHPECLQDFSSNEHLDTISSFCCSMQDFISAFSNIIKT